MVEHQGPNTIALGKRLLRSSAAVNAAQRSLPTA